MTFTFASDGTGLLVFDVGILLAFLAIGKLLDPDHLPDRLVMALLAGLAMLSYAAWRSLDTLPAPALTVQVLWSYLFYLFEMLAIAYSCGSIAILLGFADRSAEADRGAASYEASRDWPAVDVFICTYNEPLNVLEKSVVTALALDYPAKVTVFVCDDTRRSEVRAYCEEVGALYVTRADNRHAKAGNLNNALRLSAEGRTPAPLILVLDADFAPQRHFLRRTVGLLSDARVGLVQTPQFYYNCDPIQNNLGLRDSFVDDQRVFFDRLQPAKDAADCAFCVGTSFVVRRALVEAMGGFPHEALSEDLLLTLRLQQQGHVTRWLNERLSVGLSAEGLPEYVTQRTRWCLGTIQVGLLRDGPLLGSGFTLTQRLHYVHGLLSWLAKPLIVLMMIAPPLYWFADMPAFEADHLAFMRYGIPALFCFWIWSSWISGRRTLPLLTEVTHALTALPVTATLIGALRDPFGKPFKVTEKGGDRSRVVVHTRMAVVFGALALASAAAIVVTLIGPDAQSEPSDRDLFNLVWAGIAMLTAGLAFVVCFDRPRPDTEEPIAIETQVRLRMRDDGATAPLAARLTSLSAARACLDTGDAMLSATEAIELGQAGFVVAHADGDRPGTLRLSPTPAQRRAIIRMLYCEAPDNVARTGRFLPALVSAARMALRG